MNDVMQGIWNEACADNFARGPLLQHVDIEHNDARGKKAGDVDHFRRGWGHHWLPGPQIIKLQKLNGL